MLDPLSRLQDGVDGPDVRTREHRTHDALETVLDRLLRSGALPEHGGTPATVIVTITADDLARRTGYGSYPDGTPVTPTSLWTVADQAEVHTVLTDHNGAVLDLGRTQRVANKALTVALYARDKGCSFPGCGVAPTGANATTSTPGPTAAPPASTTSPCCAPTTTTTSNASDGPAT